MSESNLDTFIENKEKEFDKWVEVTGVWSKAASVHFEALAFLTFALREAYKEGVRAVKLQNKTWGSNGDMHEDQSVDDSLYFEQLGVLGYNKAIDDLEALKQRLLGEINN